MGNFVFKIISQTADSCFCKPPFCMRTGFYPKEGAARFTERQKSALAFVDFYFEQVSLNLEGSEAVQKP